MQPYSLTSIGSSNLTESTLNSAQNTLAYLIEPYELNASGNIPGNTTIGVNGQGVQISGPTSSIILSSTTTLNAVMSLLGNKGYMLFADPSTGINYIIIGHCPDGSNQMVISKPGIDVLSVFS